MGTTHARRQRRWSNWSWTPFGNFNKTKEIQQTSLWYWQHPLDLEISNKVQFKSISVVSGGKGVNKSRFRCPYTTLAKWNHLVSWRQSLPKIHHFYPLVKLHPRKRRVSDFPQMTPFSSTKRSAQGNSDPLHSPLQT